MAFGPPSWRQLTGGLTAIGVLFAGAFGIIYFARVGSLKGKTYHAFIVADDATGIFKGTEVWLQGQKVGVVKDVGFESLPSDSVVKTVLEMEVRKEYQPLIRKDSRVEFKAGGTFVGARVVSLMVGTPAAPGIGEGDTLTRVDVIDPELRANEMAAAGRDFPQIVGSLRDIGTDLDRTTTQLMSIRYHSTGLRLLAERVSNFEHRAAAKGTLPLLMHDRALSERTHRARARADSLLSLTRGSGNLGRVRGDTALRRALADTRAELAELRLRIAREDGAAGRFLDDDALQKSLRELERQIARTLADAGKYPERYSPF